MKRVLAGSHAVLEALRAKRQLPDVIYLEENLPRLDEVRRAARERDVRCEPRERAELDLLAPELRHQGVVAIGGDYPYLSLEQLLDTPTTPSLFVALDQITDPHNFGAIVRSAVAFGADGLITLKDRAVPVTGAVVRASAGATELARIARVTNLARCLQDLRDRGLQIVGLDGSATLALPAVERPTLGRVLVVGAEGTGLRRLVREQCDTLARIPMRGGFESLNASVAAAIAIYLSTSERS
jgi:23S rRNA (guanosine2251-2'-O)-methyltransferase